MEPLGVKHQEAGGGGGGSLGTGARAWLSGMDSPPTPQMQNGDPVQRRQNGGGEGEATQGPDSRRALSPIHTQSCPVSSWCHTQHHRTPPLRLF